MADARLAGSVDLFEEAAAHALEALTGVTDADLDRPTPNDGWDLRALLLHLADVADALIDLAATGELDTEVGLGTAAVAAVHSCQGCTRGNCSSHLRPLSFLGVLLNVTRGSKCSLGVPLQQAQHPTTPDASRCGSVSTRETG